MRQNLQRPGWGVTPRGRPQLLRLFTPRFVGAAVLFLSVPAGGAIDVFPLEDLKPGMRATGVSVFEGVEPDSFEVEILDVVRGMTAGGDYVLIRGVDERIQRTGIAQGMSGSPIFIDGKLVGAIAYSFSHSREPIAGVTPFGEMRSALAPDFEAARAGKTTGARTANATAWPRPMEVPSFDRWRAWTTANPAAQELTLTVPPLSAPAGLAPLSLPVLVSGRGPRAEALTAHWPRLGLQPVALPPAGSPGDASDDRRRPLGPGDAIAIQLISGDMNAAAIGTLTWVEGDRIWALGHPFLFGGGVEFPVSRARIHAVVPSGDISFKIGSGLEPLGALIGDRRPGVAALVGREARTIPLDVSLIQEGREDPETYHFSIARHELVTPTLLALAISSALQANAFDVRLASIRSHLEVTLDSGRVIRRDDFFRSLSVTQTIGTDVMSPIAYLAASPYENFPVAAVRVDLRLYDDLRAAEVHRVRVSRATVRPGDSLVVAVMLQSHFGKPETREVTLRVPEWTRGERLVVMAGSISAFTEWDQERAPDKYHPRNQADLLRLLEEFPSDESLIVRLYGPSRNLILRGHELSSLPLSKYRTLDGSASGGETADVPGASLDERVIPMGRVILGGTLVEIELAR